jgi:hypothetical protein
MMDHSDSDLLPGVVHFCTEIVYSTAAEGFLLLLVSVSLFFKAFLS